MPKPRNKENKGLPKRWTFYHNAYYYRVPKGSEHLWDGKTMFLLGKKLSEAYAKFSSRIDDANSDEIKTLGDAFDRYLIEVVPGKAPSSQVSNHHEIKWLRKVFSEMPVLPFPPSLVYKYIDKSPSKTSGRRQIATLSDVYTHLVKWGVIDRHPFKGEVKLEGEKPRKVYVEDAELEKFLSLEVEPKSNGHMIQAYIRLKMLTGIDKSTLLRMKVSECNQPEGLKIMRNKTKNSTGKETIYTWTPELKAAFSDVLASRQVDISPYLFCTEKGESYVRPVTESVSGFTSAWKRYVKKYIKETGNKVSFTERDLRKKVAIDSETEFDAQKRLSHADIRTTRTIYRFKPEKITPTK